MFKKTKLPKLEIYFYFFSWSFGVIYSVYYVYLIGNKFLYLIDQDLIEGWSFLNRKKDNLDEEWQLWVPFILYTLRTWFLVNYIGAQIIKSYFIKVLPLWYVAITALCLKFNFGINSFIVFLLQPIMFFVMTIFIKSRILIWLFYYALYYIFTLEKVISYYAVTEDQLKLLVPTLMWIYLRCISFSMYTIDKKPNIFRIYKFLAYVFYLPCFFMGPILLYDEFSKEIYRKSKKVTIISILWLMAQNIRYFIWLQITEFFLHFVYINCLLPYVELLIYIKYENVWIMYGIGFCMGLFFFLKYTVVYGFALTWSKAEGYTTPNPPKCIAHVCLYSDMWRNFDQGLYFFIKRYIFDQYMKSTFFESSLKKIWISLLCFVFVYVWHGLYYSVFMWSLLNYCGIVVETVAKRISETNYYSRFKNFLGNQNERRFIAFICAPLTIISAISNFYFLGGIEVAESYFSYIFKRGSISNTMCLWFFVYSLCQVSIELNAP